ncbi:hypothetical protein SCP_0904080 [Sparassis crispa]|uniref:Uncharacterized protein n=1 Tax=Sparassis crispa TaxID=139825 RepID=A0A401GWI0_9APHY|nr:hypothetical protein SCP_0904080 [Sparassis crispa]GBE86529.1 hypothetical protein SCP_0904080 [Sparassis crispa]
MYAKIDDFYDFFSNLASGNYQTLISEGLATKSPVATSSKRASNLDISPSAAHQPINTTLRSCNTSSGITRRDEYSFTFKHMIHDLYDIQDFAAMAEDVVRTSRMKFQPLSDEFKTRRETGAEHLRALKKRRTARRTTVNESVLQDRGWYYDVAAPTSLIDDAASPPFSGRSTFNNASATLRSARDASEGMRALCDAIQDVGGDERSMDLKLSQALQRVELQVAQGGSEALSTYQRGTFSSYCDQSPFDGEPMKEEIRVTVGGRSTMKRRRAD